MFEDRVDAGRQLAAKLKGLDEWHDAVVLGIPRGGVVVAAEVAAYLDLPLDIVMAAKVGAPGNPEYAVGAVTADGEVLVNPAAGFSATEVRALAAPALTKVKHSLDLFRGGREGPEIEDRQAIIVDDGIATGLTAEAAVEYLRRCGASQVVLAVPVAPKSAIAGLRAMADVLVTVETPEWFSAVGQFYRTFGQTTDEEVQRLLTAQRTP